MAGAGEQELQLFLSLSDGAGTTKVAESLEKTFAKIEESVGNIVASMNQLAQSGLADVQGGLFQQAAAAEDATDKITGLTLAQERFSRQLDELNKTPDVWKNIIPDTNITALGMKDAERIMEVLRSAARLPTTKLAESLREVWPDIDEATIEKFVRLRMQVGDLSRELDEKKKNTDAVLKSFEWLMKDVKQAGPLFKTLTGKVLRTTAVLLILEDTFQQINKEMETYAKANFRASGSVLDFQMQLRGLNAEFAALPEDAMKAASAVALAGFHMRDNAEDARKVTERVLMLQQAYGISAEALANFAATLKATGSEGNEIVETMDFAAKAVDMAGLSASEATALFTKLNEAAWEAYAMYGSAEAAREFSSGLATVAAAAREAQVPINDAVDAMKAVMKGGSEMIMALGSAAFNTTPAEKMAAVFENMPELMSRVKSLPPEMQEQMAKSLTGMTLNQLNALDKVGKKVGYTAEAWNKYQQEIEAQREVEEAYRASLDTLTGIMRQVLMPVLSALTTILTPIANAFVLLMKPISVVVKWIGKLLNTEVGQWAVMIVGSIVAIRVAMNLLNLTMKSSLIGMVLLGVVWAIDKLTSSDLPGWIKDTVIAIAGLSGLFILFGGKIKAAFAALNLFSKGPKILSTIGDGFKNAKKGVEGFFDKLKGGQKGGETAQIGPKVSKTFKDRMQSLKDGLMVFAQNSGQILRGALTFAAAMTILMIPVVLVAWIVKELGISATELAIVAGVMLAGMLVMAAVVPILAGVGAGFMAILAPIAAFAAGLALIGAAMIPGAYAMGLFADAVKKLNGANLIALAGSMAVMAAGMLAFAGAVILMAPAVLLFAALAAGMMAANLLMAAAMFIFPTTDFGLMAAHMERFSNALKEMPSGIGATFAQIRDILDDIDDMEDADLSVLFKLAEGSQVFLGASRHIGEFASALGRIATSFDEIYAAGDQKISLTDMLVGDIVENEAKFKKAADILNEYAKSMVEYTNAIGDNTNKVSVAEEAVDQVFGDFADVFGFGPQSSKVKPVANQLPQLASNDESSSRMVSILEKQLKKLDSIDNKDQADSSSVEEKLQRVIERLDDVIDKLRGGPGIGEANVWQ